MSLVAQRRWIKPTKPGNGPDGIPALVAQVLAGRGFAAVEMAGFLAARPAEEAPPMLDLDRAAERLPPQVAGLPHMRGHAGDCGRRVDRSGILAAGCRPARR